jgi:hypothetical protein
MNEILEKVIVGLGVGLVLGLISILGSIITYIRVGGNFKDAIVYLAIKTIVNNENDLEEEKKDIENNESTSDPFKRMANLENIESKNKRMLMIKLHKEGFNKLKRKDKSKIGSLVRQSNELEKSLLLIQDSDQRIKIKNEIEKLYIEIKKLISD